MLMILMFDANLGYIFPCVPVISEGIKGKFNTSHDMFHSICIPKFSSNNSPVYRYFFCYPSEFMHVICYKQASYFSMLRIAILIVKNALA